MDVDPNHTTNKQKDDDGELSMETDEFPFPTSQSVDDTFREATLVATLAESFSLTHFKAFQKDVITTTLECFNLLEVVSPFAFNSLPSMKTRKQLSSAQQ